MAVKDLLQALSLNNVKRSLGNTRANLSSGFSNVKAASQNFGKVNALTAIGDAAANIPSIRKSYQRDPVSTIPQTAINYSLNSGQAFLGGLADAGTGVKRFISRPSIPAATQIVRGGFGMTTPVNPSTVLPFSVANLIASLPQNKTKMISPTSGRITEASELQRTAAGFLKGQTGQQTMASNVFEDKTFNLLGNKIDPYMGVGSMLGFSQGPMQKVLFKGTNKFIPSSSDTILKFLTTTAIRGGVEDVFLSMPEFPENASDRDKAMYILQNAGTGAASEILGTTLFSVGPKAFVKQIGKQLDTPSGKIITKQLGEVFDKLKRRARIEAIDIKNKVKKPGTVLYEGRRLIGDQSGFIKPNEFIPRKKSEPIKISDILEKKKIKVKESPIEPDMNTKRAELIAERFGVDQEFVLKKIKQGYSPQKIYEGFSSAAQSPTEIKSKEGWISGYLDNWEKPTNKIKLQVKPEEPKTNLKALKEKFKTMKTEEVINTMKPTIDKIATKVKEIGYTFDKLVDAIETRNIPPELEGAAKSVESIFNTFKEIRQEKFGDKIGTLPDYWRRISEEGLENIEQRSFGETIGKAGFSFSRKGTLENYVKDERVLLSYIKEAMGGGDLTDTQIKEVKLGNELKDIAIDPKQKTNVDFVTKVEDAGLKTDVKKTYKDVHKNLFTRTKDAFLRGIDDRVAMIKDPEFYKDFLDPFKKANTDLGKYVNELSSKNIDVKQKNTLIFREMKRLQTEAANKFMENVKNADIKQGTLRTLVNDIAENYIIKDARNKSNAKKVMALVRGMTGRGALGFNVASAINNIFETKRIAASVSTKSLKNAIKRIATGEDLTTKYQTKSMDTALERSTTKKLIKKIDKALFYLFDKSENFKDNLMLLALEEQAVEKGLTGKAARIFVQQKFSKLAIKYGKGQDIGMYQNDLVKTLGQFGQYAIKDLVLLGDKIGGTVKGDIGDRKYLIKYAALSGLQIAAFQALLGTSGFGGQTGTPIDFLNDFITKGGVNSPITNLVVNLYHTATVDEDESAYDKSLRNNSLIRTGATMAIPASNQLYFKTGKYLKARNEGNYKMYNGKVAGPVGTSVPNTIKGVLFGRSYDSERQDYINSLYSDKKDESKTAINTQPTIEQNVPSAKKAILYKDARSTLSGYEKAKTKILYQNEYDNDAKKQEALQELDKKFSDSLDYIRQFEDANDTKAIDTYLGIDDVTKLKTNTSWEKISKDKKAYTKAAQLLYKLEYPDNKQFDLPEKQVLEAIERMGINTDDAFYYSKASKTNDEKTAYVMDAIQKLAPKNRTDMLKYLVNARKLVNGKMLLADGVINDLYDQGLLTEEEKKRLKNFSFSQDGSGKITPKVKVSGRGSGAKLKAIKLKQPEKANISTPKIQGINFGGFKAPSLAKVDMNKLKLDPNKYIKLNKQKFSGISSPTYRV